MSRRSSRQFQMVALGFAVLLVGTNLPSPLYQVYQQRFGFTTGLLTLIFATQAVVVVPSLLGLGAMSDHIGRRPVILAGLALAAAACALFALATGPGWLFAARAMQGAAVGASTGALTAALVELEPTGDRHRAALAATLAGAAGVAVGPLLAGGLAEWAPAPLTLCYLVEIALLAAAAAAVRTVSESGERAPGRWRPQWPRVPSGGWAAFLRATVVGALAWAVAGLFLAVGAPYAAELLSTDNLALHGALGFGMLATSCVAQLGFRTTSPRTAQVAGLVLTVTGLAALVLAFPPASLALLLVGTLLAGVGHGLAFAGSQRDIDVLAPDDSRAGLNSAYYLGIYLSVAVSTTGVGFLADAVTLAGAVRVFAVAIGVAGLVGTAWILLGRPP
jgi:predicted MFS family arabinose efflux permease